jgi:chitodextrinase
MPIAFSQFGADFTTMRSRGGDVIPSFGGYTADNTGTEIADSCTDVSAIAAAYEKVVSTYDVSRLDMDIEDNSLNKAAGIDRRNKALKMAQDWAAANGRTLQISYTLPTTTHGLLDGTAGDGSGLSVIRNAVANGVDVGVVNLMTFDYYDNASHQMADDTRTAAQGLHDQLAALYPSKSDARIWNMIGIIEMPGIDDFGAAETFTTADAAAVYDWAVGKGVNTLSFWALQRDNGGCPGQGGSDTCSGIAQDTWYFSHTFARFNAGGTTPPPANDFSVSLSPSSASVTAGRSATTTVHTAVTAGAAQQVALGVSGLPAGVTATVSPGSVTAGGDATLTVKSTASAVSGTYHLSVTGTASGAARVATYTLTVTGGGTACAAAPWSGSAIYVGGNTVSYQGHTWKAKWWTTGETPGTTGEWGVWQDLGAC